MTVEEVVKHIIRDMAKGRRDYERYIDWLRNEGLTEREAEKILDRIIDVPDEKEDS